MTTQDNGFPAQGNITNIDQLARIQEYIDNKILDGIMGAAATVDKLQTNVTLIHGTILQNVGKRIKQALQGQGRVIARLQKKIDAVSPSMANLPVTEQTAVNDIAESAPIEVEDIPSGTIPSKTVLPLVPDGNINGGSPNVGDPCTPGFSYTDPNTCIIYSCGPDGTIIVSGEDQACINAKKGNNGNGGNPPPPPPPPVCFDPNYPTQNTNTYICSFGDTLDTNTSFSQETSELISDYLSSLRNVPFDQYMGCGSYPVGFMGNVKARNIVNDLGNSFSFTMPVSRSSQNNVSIYSDDGFYYLNNKYNGRGVDLLSDGQTTYSDMINSNIAPDQIGYIADGSADYTYPTNYV